MKTLDQIRNQLSVMPCRFAGGANPQPIPLSVAAGQDGSTSEISLLYGFPTETADAPDGVSGLWVLRGDVNSAGCLASDELFFRMCGGIHSFSSDVIAGGTGQRYVSSVFAVVSSVTMEFARNPSFDVSGDLQPYYAWTNGGDTVYTTVTGPMQGDFLYSIQSAPKFARADGITVSSFSESPLSIGVNGATCPRDASKDYTSASGFVYYGWQGGWYTQSQTPSVGSSVYTRSDTGISATKLSYAVSSVNETVSGDGYPEGAVLEYEEVAPYAMKVMSVVEDNMVDFTATQSELQTGKNWKLVEPDKDFDIDAVVAQVDWSRTNVGPSGRWFSYVPTKPSGFFAKYTGVTAGSGIAGVVVAVKDEEEAKGY